MLHKEIIIKGEPVAKGRPRFRNCGSFVSAYTPAKTKNAEKSIKEQLREYFTDLPSQKPIRIEFVFYFGIPKSYSKKKIKELETNKFLHTNKPDADNVAKLYLDAMNGLVFNDDKQIATLKITKLYTFLEPRTEIIIDEY